MQTSIIFFVYFNVLLLHYTMTCYAYSACSSNVATTMGLEPELCVNLIGNHENRIFMEKTHTRNDTTTKMQAYYSKDQFTLICVRKFQNLSNCIDCPSTLQWKLQQRNLDLLVTTETVKTNKSIEEISYQVSFVLGRLDNLLTATCEAYNGHQRTNNISITFLFISPASGSTKPAQIKEMKITREVIEGQRVPNEYNNTVSLYRNGNLEKVIRPNNMIFDPITTEDNGTICIAWFEDAKKIDGFKVLSKQRWKVIVKPNYLLDPKEPEQGNSTFPTMAVVAGIVAPIVVISVIAYAYFKYFKRRETYNKHESHEQTYAEPADVVYTKVYLKASNNPTPKRTDEPYAQIIGVVKPKRKLNTKSTEPETQSEF